MSLCVGTTLSYRPLGAPLLGSCGPEESTAGVGRPVTCLVHDVRPRDDDGETTFAEVGEGAGSGGDVYPRSDRGLASARGPTGVWRLLEVRQGSSGGEGRPEGLPKHLEEKKTPVSDERCRGG